MAKNLKDNKLAGKLVADLSYLAHSYFASYWPTTADLKHRILNEWRRNKSIVILKPDKGKGVVVL